MDVVEIVRVNSNPTHAVIYVVMMYRDVVTSYCYCWMLRLVTQNRTHTTQTLKGD